jgi:hypothetical protein
MLSNRVVVVIYDANTIVGSRGELRSEAQLEGSEQPGGGIV